MRCLCPWLTVVTIGIGCTSAICGTTLQISEAFRGRKSVSANAEYFEDASASLSFDEIRNRPDFRRNTTEALNFGLTSSVVWLRFDLHNSDQRERELFLHIDFPLTDSFKLYTIDAAGRTVVRQAGQMFRFSDREIQNRNFLFRIVSPPQSTTRFFLRVQSEDTMQVPAWIWTPDEFFRHDHNEQIGLGIYYGIILVTIAYNLFLFFSVRDRSYLAYVGYVFAIGLFAFSQHGLAFEYLWPDHPLFAHRFNPVIGSVMIAFACLFTDSFLNLRRNASRLYPVIRVLMVLGLSNAVLSAFVGLSISARTLGVLSISVVFTLLFAGSVMLSRGFRPARYYFSAFLVLLIMGGVYALKVLGVVPSNFLTTYGLQIGSTVEVVLLSLGLGDRINTMRTEKERAEASELQHREALAKLEVELEVARQIQRAILPTETPRMPGIRVAARYVPMTSVGGDFYDFYRVSDSLLGILIADVSGHGVPAALIASMLKVAAAEQIGLAATPDKFLQAVHGSITGKIKEEFVTASFALLDTTRNRLHCASAGHPPLLWQSARNRSIVEIRPAGRLMGPYVDLACRSAEHETSSGDRIIFYTDGVTESRNNAGEEFENSLQSFALSHAADPAETFCDSLLDELHRWSGSQGAFEDDVTFIVVDIGNR